MLRALFTGVSGLRAHQRRMDVIGNNIANVDTVGFKASRVTFEEGFAQVLARASAASGRRESQDPQQVGSGVTLGSVSPRFTQGDLIETGNALDLAIHGDGFFVLRDGERTLYSRAGNFVLDPSGDLRLDGTSFTLQGGRGTPTGRVGSGAASDLSLDLDAASAAVATSAIEISGNLDAAAAVGTQHTLSATVFDPAGEPHAVTLAFTKADATSWTWTASTPNGTTGPGGTVVFDAAGQVSEIRYDGGASGLTVTPNDGGSFTVALEAGARGLTTLAAASTASMTGQNGRAAGQLSGLEIGVDGQIMGLYSNGTSEVLGQVMLARFANPEGLVRAAGNTFEATTASGEAALGAAGNPGGPAVLSGALEGSNVDVASEFTTMILTQRGFQASARIIATADAILSELARLKR